MDEYLGIIKLFAGNFAPQSFAYCQGQQMNINTNQALYSLLGVVYGGNGTTTFNLPNLAGRVPLGSGTSNGVAYVPGQVGGATTANLTINNMPSHSHTANTVLSPSSSITIMASNEQAESSVPDATYNVLGAPYYDNGGNEVWGYNSKTPNTPLRVGTVSISGLTTTVGAMGGSQPFSIMPPYQVLNYVITIQGIYPSRN